MKNLKKIIEISYKRKTGHIGSCLSCLPIIEKIFEENEAPLVVLSKGHAALAYYVVLWSKGIITEDELDTYCDPEGTKFYGHVSRNTQANTEFTLGSLGHGLPLAAGYSFVNTERKVFCILGDGELDEGTIYETLQFLRDKNLPNFKVIIDHNKFKGFSEQKIDPNLRSYLESFDFVEIVETVKGGSISCINKLGLMSHYVKIDDSLYNQIMEELECQEK
jgi:transketolase